MRMNRKLAPQIAASPSRYRVSTGLTENSYANKPASVAQRPA
jgi:hypothetical protein